MSRLPYAIAALVALGVGATCAVSRCPGADELPDPLWTRQDLPPLPAEDDNGWIVVLRAAEGRPDTTPPDAAINALIDGASDRHDDVWSELLEARGELDAWRTGAGTRAALASFREAAAMPTFADACPIGPYSRCPHFVIFGITRAATVHALWQASRGDLAAAGEELAAVIACQRRSRDSARTLMAAMVANATLREAFEAASLLMWRASRTPGSEREPLAKLRQELEASAGPSPVARHAVIGEYVLAMTYLNAVAEGEAEVGGWAPEWVFDPVWTRERFDRSYRRSMALAAGESTVPVGPDELKWMDRALHPVGASLWAMLDPSMITDTQVAKLRADSEDLERRGQALLARFR